METSIGFYSRVLGFEVARNESGNYAVPSERRSRTWDRADLQAPRGGRVLHQGHSLVAAGARSLVDQAMLEYGQLPRSVMRRYAGNLPASPAAPPRRLP